MNVLCLDLGGAWIKCSIINTITKNELYIESVNYKLAKSKDKNNNIPIDKVNETIDIINKFINIGKRYNIQKIIGIATGGLRQANNGNEVINYINNKLNINIRIVDGKEEALLTRKGVLASINNISNTKIYCNFDIGSSSTEITYGTINKIYNTYSIDIGNTNFTSMFDLSKGIISDTTLAKLILFLKNKFSDVKVYNSNRYDIEYILTGSSGFNPIIYNSNNTLTDVDIKKKAIWDISINMVYKLMRSLQKDRSVVEVSDVSFGECIILYVLMRYIFKVNSIKYSTKGLRVGMVV